MAYENLWSSYLGTTDGKDPETFFNEASVLFEDLSDCDIRIGGGDLNARTKEMED